MTPAQAMDVGNNLIQLLTQQRLLCRQLQDLARKQSKLVDGSNPEMLLRVLAGRQRIIDRLATLDKELKPIRHEWQKIALALPPAQRTQAQQLVAEVQDILGEIITRDEKDTQVLYSQQQKVAGEIKTTNVGKRMNQAYGQNNTVEKNRYLDTVSK
jgi:HPt (histidine-containing phosphotransfer) domain-containing protein